MVEVIYFNGTFEVVSKALFFNILKLKKNEIYRYRYIKRK